MKVGETYYIKNKIAPGLNAGTEFTIEHIDDDEKHLIVSVMVDEKALIDGVLTRVQMPQTHRIAVGSMKKAVPAEEAKAL